MPGRASKAGRSILFRLVVRLGHRLARPVRAGVQRCSAVRRTALRQWRRVHGRAGRGQGRVLRGPVIVAVSLAAYGLLLPTGWAVAGTGRYRASAERVPPMPVAVVFGAGLFGDRPSPFLARRLDLGAELYRRGKVGAVLVSGDNSRDDYDETGAMRAYLMSAGVPGRKIVGDHAGFDTWDSCVRARRIFGVDRAIVVTQRFHLARAVALCRAAGIEAWGVGDDTFSDYPAPSANSYARELPAMVKAAYDAVVKPDPHFLGRRETGVQDALATK